MYSICTSLSPDRSLSPPSEGSVNQGSLRFGVERAPIPRSVWECRQPSSGPHWRWRRAERPGPCTPDCGSGGCPAERHQQQYAVFNTAVSPFWSNLSNP